MEKPSECTNQSLEASLLEALRFPIKDAIEEFAIPQEHCASSSSVLKSKASDVAYKESPGTNEKKTHNCWVERCLDIQTSRAVRQCGGGEHKSATDVNVLELLNSWVQLVAATTWTTCSRKMAERHAEQIAHKDGLLEQQLQHLQELRRQLQLKENQVNVLEKQLQVRRAIHSKELQERDDFWKRELESLKLKSRSPTALENEAVCAVERKPEAEVLKAAHNLNPAQGVHTGGEQTSLIKQLNCAHGWNAAETMERRLCSSDVLVATDACGRRRVRQGSGQPRGASGSNDFKGRPVCEKENIRTRALSALQGLSHFQLRKAVSQMVMRARPETPSSSEQTESTNTVNVGVKIPSSNTLGTLSKNELAKVLLDLLGPSEEAVIAEAKGPLQVRRILCDYTSSGIGGRLT